MASVILLTKSKSGCLILALAAVQLFAAAAPASEDFADLVDRVRPAFGTVIVMDATGKPAAQGSGFFMTENGFFVTNHHVIEGAYGAVIRTTSGEYTVRGVAADDPARDIAILAAELPEKTKLTCLKFHNALPRVGEHVLVLSTPRGLQCTASDGIVSALRYFPGKPGRIIQMSAPISPGSSGGPLINTDGEVLGVATLTRVDCQNVNYAMPSSFITSLRPGEPISLADVTSQALEKLFFDADALQQEGKWAESVPLLKQVLAAKPDHAAAWFHLGRGLAEIGSHYTQAIEAYRQFLKLRPSSTDASRAWNNIGVTRAHLDENREAQSAYEKAVGSDAENVVAWRNLGATSLSLQDYPMACASFRQVIHLDPSDESARSDLARSTNNYGVQLFKAKQLAAAAPLFREALGIDPTDATARRNLATCYNNPATEMMRTGDFANAAALLRDAINIDAEYAQPYFNLGLIAVNSHDVVGANICYGKLLVLDAALAERLREQM